MIAVVARKSLKAEKMERMGWIEYFGKMEC